MATSFVLVEVNMSETKAVITEAEKAIKPYLHENIKIVPINISHVLLIHDDGGWIEGVFLEYAEDEYFHKDPDGFYFDKAYPKVFAIHSKDFEPIFSFVGHSGLREGAHFSFGDKDGYLHYPPFKEIMKAVEYLDKNYFDLLN